MTKAKIDAELIRTLAEIMADTGLTRLEYEEEDSSLVLSRELPPTQTVFAPPPPVTVTTPVTVGPAQASAPAATVDGGRGSGDAGAVAGGVRITSPMVGTAYLQAEPGAPPFVRPGDEVREGQTILIIEAMKVMNPIPAPASGRIVSILVESGQPVEYGEVLMQMIPG